MTVTPHNVYLIPENNHLPPHTNIFHLLVAIFCPTAELRNLVQ